MNTRPDASDSATVTNQPWEVIRLAADRIEEIAEKATKRICREWTRQTIRHIARNVDVDCGHRVNLEENGRTYYDQDPQDGWNHYGWDRYNDAPWYILMDPAVAEPLVTWLRAASRMWELYDRPHLGWTEQDAASKVSHSDRVALDFARQVLSFADPEGSPT